MTRFLLGGAIFVALTDTYGGAIAILIAGTILVAVLMIETVRETAKLNRDNLDARTATRRWAEWTALDRMRGAPR